MTNDPRDLLLADVLTLCRPERSEIRVSVAFALNDSVEIRNHL